MTAPSDTVSDSVPNDIVAAPRTPDGDTDLTAAQVTHLLSSGTRETLTTSREAAETYIRPLVAAGLQIIPLVPGAKNPALTEWQRIPVTDESWTFWLDDAYARRNAFSTGRPALGLGLRAGARMVPADADTDAQVATIHAFAANMGLEAPVPTTSTPGTVDRRHANGGHWWFLLPADFAIPNTLPGVLKVDARGNTGADAYGDTFDLFLYGHQAAIPPTVREPGEYTLTGPVYDMPEKMREWLIHQGTLAEASHAAAVAERAARVNRGESNPAVNIWEDDHSWADILTTANWIETGRDARCGCTQWRHPEASSEKSATAHECARGTYLHLWSTSSSTLQAGSYRKMYVDAALHHGGDYAAACRAAGIPPVSRAIRRSTSPWPAAGSTATPVPRTTGPTGRRTPRPPRVRRLPRPPAVRLSATTLTCTRRATPTTRNCWRRSSTSTTGPGRSTATPGHGASTLRRWLSC